MIGTDKWNRQILQIGETVTYEKPVAAPLPWKMDICGFRHKWRSALSITLRREMCCHKHPRGSVRVMNGSVKTSVAFTGRKDSSSDLM